LEKVKAIIESLLFVARKPLSPEDVVHALTDVKSEKVVPATRELVTAILEELVSEYQTKGIRIVKVAGGYLMGTNPENADYVHQLLHAKVETTLSPQSLVTLAIIAYKQPVTRAEIERIRGVNTDGPIDTLLAKGLIREIGRSDAVGCPYLYGTSEHFLRQFGIHSLDELPPLPESEQEQEAVFENVLHEPEPSPDM
jgi:segregation and condensation protein B